VSDGLGWGMFSLDDYYIPIVVLANVVMRLACIVCSPEGSIKAAGRVVLMSGQVLPSTSHRRFLRERATQARNNHGMICELVCCLT
jgi:hypothetical protein